MTGSIFRKTGLRDSDQISPEKIKRTERQRMEKKRNNTVHTHTLEDGTVVTHMHETAHEMNGNHEHSQEAAGGHGHSHAVEAHEHAHGHNHTHTHENTKAVLNRLSRAIGHLESIRRMVEDGRDCSEVLIQLSAVKSAINNTGKVILQDHIQHCLVDAIESGDMETIEELNKAIDRFIK